MKCNECWRKASWSMKTILYGNTFYKFICTKHYIEEGLLLLDIKGKQKEKLGGKS
ncbi:hypothetical protein SHM_28520 (plasmid) [Spiroplasma ixodetis]|uniref:Uncharacterized protein n=1 Tax=Spiroplasma ixodetis TaxID=2141 RepID=A0ABN6T1C6_9MOLU|nr:hypothetical protein SHM_28520 [Spiroplasma ixodetis]